MISLLIKPDGPVDYDRGEYCQATIDQVHEDGRIEVLVDPHTVDAEYVAEIDIWPDEFQGSKFIHRIKTIKNVWSVQWEGHDVLNAEDVCYELEDLQ